MSKSLSDRLSGGLEVMVVLCVSSFRKVNLEGIYFLFIVSVCNRL